MAFRVEILMFHWFAPEYEIIQALWGPISSHCPGVKNTPLDLDMASPLRLSTHMVQVWWGVIEYFPGYFAANIIGSPLAA